MRKNSRVGSQSKVGLWLRVARSRSTAKNVAVNDPKGNYGFYSVSGDIIKDTPFSTILWNSTGGILILFVLVFLNKFFECPKILTFEGRGIFNDMSGFEKNSTFKNCILNLTIQKIAHFLYLCRGLFIG